MKINLCLFWIFISSFCLDAIAQSIHIKDWNMYSAMYSSTSASTDWDNRIWISSTGGISIYNTYEDNNPIILNANNGLLDPSINVLSYVPTLNTMMCGSSNGVLTLIRQSESEFTHITGIRDHGLSNPKINDICILQKDDNSNIALIAGGFGIVEFDLDKEIFGSSIFTIGNFSINTTVNNMILEDDTIWVATSMGIGFISAGQRLNVPSNWKTFAYPTEYSEASIIRYNNEIYVNLGQSIYRFDGNGFKLILDMIYPTSWNITYTGINVYKDKLLLSTTYAIFSINDLENVSDTTIITIPKAWDNKKSIILPHSNVDLIILHERLGCDFYKEEIGEIAKKPNAPYNTSFCSLVLDNNGKLYAASDNSQKTSNKGFMAFDGSNWTNYTANLSAIPSDIPGNSYHAVSVSPDNKVYVSTWGGGLLEIDARDTPTVFHYWDHNNSALVGYNADSSYVITGQTRWDNQNRMWVVGYAENRVGTMLVTFDGAGNSIGFTNRIPGDLSSRYAFTLAIDANNTKWIGSHQVTFPKGLYYFNEQGSLNDTTDDIWGNISTGEYPNLIGNKFTCVQYDNFTNTVWLGTSSGIAIINNPSAALTNSKFVIIQNKLLESQFINDIFIDAVGNKWISTRNGIWVISTDGSELLAHFTTSNTPLTINDVQAVVINSANGLIYIGTKLGLFTAKSSVLLPLDEYSLKVYPQPFNIKKHEQITIEGLTTDSDIRIVTPAGVLIRRIETFSKNAVWDGKDSNGNIVPVGMYLVIASSVVSKSSGVAKVVIVE